MADPGDIREGLAASLASLDMQVSAYVLDSPTPPCAYVQSGPIDYDATFGRGVDVWTFTVFVLVGMVSDIGAQKQLDRMLMSHGATSIKTLLEADRSLGGVALSMSVTEVTGTRVYVLDQQQQRVLGAEWTVIVNADGRE
jgi:hypothetical protein